MKDLKMDIDSAWSNIYSGQAAQKEFSDKFFSDNLSHDQKVIQTLKFSEAMHSEISQLCASINYKSNGNESETTGIKYQLADIYRYVLAMMNLWGISSSEFVESLENKNNYLYMKHTFNMNEIAKGQPVLIVDLDDILANFRDAFCAYLRSHGVNAYPTSTEYYCVAEIKAAGLNNDDLFNSFVNSGKLKSLTANNSYLNLLRKILMHEKDVWVEIVTARPGDNLNVKYDTYSWIKSQGVNVDRVNFAKEKFAWLAGQSYYNTSKIVAIDDSGKHALEYARHGVKCFMPDTTYNQGIAHENIHRFHTVDNELFHQIMQQFY